MKICPKCGKSDTNMEFIGSLCVDCYAKQIEISYETAELKKCSICKRRIVKNKSVDFEETDLKGIVEKTLSGIIRIIKTACTECNKKTGGYFEAIIQLRSDNKARTEQFASGIIKKIEEESFIAKIEELKNGFDLYVGDRKVALKAVKGFNLPFTTASQLAGKKDGNDLYRI